MCSHTSVSPHYGLYIYTRVSCGCGLITALSLTMMVTSLYIESTLVGYIHTIYNVLILQCIVYIPHPSSYNEQQKHLCYIQHAHSTAYKTSLPDRDTYKHINKEKEQEFENTDTKSYAAPSGLNVFD